MNAAAKCSRRKLLPDRMWCKDVRHLDQLVAATGKPAYLDAERGRLRKEQQKLEKELQSLKGQLDNQQFLSKAPPAVVSSLRQRQEECSAQLDKVLESLRKLG